MDFTKDSKICSFCGKVGSRSNRLAGGLGAMICFQCLEFLHKAASSPRSIAEMSRPPWDDMTDTEMLAKLPLILRSADQNVAFASDWVDLMRHRNISWAQIGNALGVSRQAVWERFAKRGESKDASTA